MECPCRYCDKRNAECHGRCQEYKEWNEANTVERKRCSDNINLTRMLDEDIICKRIKRKRGK